MKKSYEKEFKVDIRRTVDIHQKIGDYQRELINWMFSSDDGRDDRQLSDMGMEEFHGGNY